MKPADAAGDDPRVRLFIQFCVCVLIATLAYVLVARARAGTARLTPPKEHPAGSQVAIEDPDAYARLRGVPHLAFRHVGSGLRSRTLAFAPLDAPSRTRYTTDLMCDRVYESHGTLVCLDRSDGRLAVRLLDDTLTVRKVSKTVGVASRTRVSRDGRLAAYTLFIGADSYATTGFSTRTAIMEVASGKRIADLESFTAWQDGEELRSPDFNFWGVTFSNDASTFYATLGTHGHTYLVRGDLEARRVVVVRDGVECPSLSPDQTRIAFKKKTDRPGEWRPAILDLASGTERVLPETRNVDDQIEWLDDRRVLYAVVDTSKVPRVHIWVTSADGSGRPQLFLEDADSPSVVRPR